jgi:hypothetical protein
MIVRQTATLKQVAGGVAISPLDTNHQKLLWHVAHEVYLGASV